MVEEKHWLEMLERAMAIARELGDGWTAVEHGNDRTACLVGPGSWMWLSVRHNRYKGRLEVAPCPWKAGISGVSFDGEIPIITVAAEREDAAVARDIRRRLLADAERFMAEAYLRARMKEDSIATTQRTVAQLVELSRGGLSAPSTGDPRATDVSLWANDSIIGSYGHFRVLTGGYVEIHLRHLPAATAAAVLELLVSLTTENGAA